jgi:hypothetical protein
MILGVSHILYCARDLVFEPLTAIGYRERFIDSDVGSPSSKWQFMRYPSTTHTLALFDRRSCPSIELIIYPEVVDHLEPCLRLQLPLDSQVVGMHGVEQVGVAGEEALVEMQTTDSGATSALLTGGLGFKHREDSRYSFRSVRPEWSIGITLVQSDKPEPLLDQTGPNCISFLSTDLARDRQRLLDAGVVASTEPFGVEVGGKDVLAEIFRGPGGEFVELIQVLS